jgi:molybdopterin biosynthesis enzyme
LPAKLVFNEKPQLSAEPVKWGGSSDFVAFSKADCLIHVPQGKTFGSGTIVDFVYLP